MDLKQIENKRKDSSDSSSLNFLNDQQQEIDESKIDHDNSKRQRSLFDNNRSSEQVRKIFVGCRRKEKFIQSQSTHQGIFLYKPGVDLPSLFDYCNQTIIVIISGQYIQPKRIQTIKDKIYGTDTYTSNSDLLGIAVHSGFIQLDSFNFQKYQGIQMHYKVIKPKRNYVGSFKNGIFSKTLKTYNGFTLKPESQKMLISLPSLKLLEQYASNMHIPIGKSRRRSEPKNINAIIPVPGTHLTFNMNNEPAHKYSLINITDKGYDRSQFLSSKLEDLVLYLETVNKQKFQICKTTQNVYFRVFTVSRLKNPQKHDNLFFKNYGAPVTQEFKQIIHYGLQWDQIIWCEDGVIFKDIKIIGLQSYKLYQKTRPN